jgi:16S rRNA processing protein RimM
MKPRGPITNTINSGSLNDSEPEFLAVGKIRKPFGLAGDLKFGSYIDELSVFLPGSQIYTGKRLTPRKIIAFRKSGKDLLIRFEGIHTPEDARELTNQAMYILSDCLPELKEGGFYHLQLIDMRVEDKNGQVLGKISEIIETGANDVYVVTGDSGSSEILIPAIKSVVLKIDLESNIMVVEQQEWLD